MNVSAITPVPASTGPASGEPPAPVAPPPAAKPGVKIVSEFDDSGALIARVVEADSDKILYQVPPQQVLDVVTHLLELVERRGEQRV
jgi:hypothetical protein